MTDHPTPPSDSRRTPTSVQRRSTRGMVRRARIEHLAAELLRLGDALRLPVPAEDLYRTPPQHLWPGGVDHPAGGDQVDPYGGRWEIARAVGRAVSDSAWPLRAQLLGDQPLAESEIDLFAIALLLPTALLAGISEQQRSQPETVARLSQVPLKHTALRLGELGYLPGSAAVHHDTTD